MIGALIGAGSSLLGGILGKPKRESAEQNSREAILGQAAGAREAADKYGFNPLTLLGVSSAVGPSTTSNYMGQSIAEAGMIMADHLSRQRNPGALSQLQSENQKLRQQVQNQTLRPRVGGIYSGTEATPSVPRSATGGVNAQTPEMVLDASGVAHARGVHRQPDDIRLDRGDGVYIGGRYVASAPGWSPAEIIETEYGDVASWAYGLGRLGADAIHWLRQERQRNVMARGAPPRPWHIPYSLERGITPRPPLRLMATQPRR